MPTSSAKCSMALLAGNPGFELLTFPFEHFPFERLVASKALARLGWTAHVPPEGPSTGGRPKYPRTAHVPPDGPRAAG